MRRRVVLFRLWYLLCWHVPDIESVEPLPAADREDTIHELRREHYSELTFSKVDRYRLGDRPFIITGIPASQSVCFGGRAPYNDSLLLKHCRGKVWVSEMCDPAKFRKSSCKLGRLKISRFLKRFAEEKGFERAYGWKSPVFAEDVFIASACPKLVMDTRIPAYFSGQIRPFHAEFYFSTQGYQQSFHIDRKPAELWSAMCRGTKRYRVVPRSIVWKTLGSEVDLDQLLRRPAAWPLGLPIWEGVASAGDVVYIPAGAVHAVDTLSDSVTIVNDFLYTGHFGRTSRVNHALSPGLHLPELDKNGVFDGKGIVAEPNFSARGFPSLWDFQMFAAAQERDLAAFPQFERK